jgi:hypothetical protein
MAAIGIDREKLRAIKPSIGYGNLASYPRPRESPQGLRYGGVPWIIGEAFYDDVSEAAALREEITSTGQPVLYLTQWPLTADSSCADVNVAPPTHFSNYQVEGF